MSSSVRSLVLRVALALVVVGVAIWVLLLVVDNRPDLQVDDPDDVAAEVALDRLSSLDSEIEDLLRVESASGPVTFEYALVDRRVIVPFLSNDCPQANLTLARRGGGLGIELTSRGGGCDDLGEIWVATIHLHDEPDPDAPMDVEVDDRG